ncbi:MAG: choice-of-anchor J domain-containing protein [Muribaculaceae bacterium]|nr:choice-of-anchor J domain-containing protein [Muribaculaceae bacterium]
MKKALAGTAILMATCCISATAAEYVPKIIAGVVKCDSWTSVAKQAEGLYELDAVPGGELRRLQTERDVYAAPLGGGVYEDGKLKGIHFRTFDDPYSASGISYAIYSVEYDLETYECTKKKALSDLYGNLISSTGVTKDPTTGINYGIFYNFNMNYEVLDRKLCTIDYTPDIPKKNQIAVITMNFCAIAAGEDGRLYAINRDGYLYTLNKSNGRETLIGDTGVTDISANPSSMTFDPRTKKLYWSYVSSSGKSYLYEVNYKVGEVSATKIMQLPDNAYLVNLIIKPAKAQDGAPAACADLSTNFEGESYSGTVSFTLPTLSYDGDPMNDSMEYTIYDNDRVAATGTGTPGERIEKEVVTLGGETTIKVVASNEVGAGAPVSVTLYTGLDIPNKVTEASCAYEPDEQTAVITWVAPQTGTHGLTLSNENLSYNLFRMPGKVSIATGIKTTRYTDAISNNKALQSYWYEIEPVNGTIKGESTTTNKIVVGQSLKVPYSEDFRKSTSFDTYTVIDANKDGSTWERYHYTYTYSDTTVDYARIDADDNNDDDDWLLLPPLSLDKGSVYKFEFTAKKQYNPAYCNQKVEAWAGRGTDVSKFKKILDTVNVTDVNFNDYSAEFMADADGDWHVALHATSPAGSSSLEIDKVSVTQLTSGQSPAAPEILSLIPDATGDMKAEMKLRLPSERMNETPLESIDRVEVTDAKGNIVGTHGNATPGIEITIELKPVINGDNTFSARCFNNNNGGASAMASAYIGQDTPLPPTNITLYDDGENAMLKWEAPKAGANGGYINPERITYNLYTISDYGYPILLKEGVTSPYYTGVKSGEGDQTLLYYAMRAVTTGGESEAVATNGLVIGAPYTLPYQESFAQAQWPESFVWLEGEYADWNMGPTSGTSSDADGGAFIFTPNRAEFGIFNLGKIELKGATCPVLKFDIYEYPGSLSTLDIAIDRFPQGVAETISSYRFDKSEKEGWKEAVVDLRKYTDEKFVIVKFALASSSKETPVVIDNLRLVDDPSGVTITPDNEAPFDIYSIDGMIVRRNAISTDGLPKGIYIVKGQKIRI